MTRPTPAEAGAEKIVGTIGEVDDTGGGVHGEADLYVAHRIKGRRRRATAAEMEERAGWLVFLASEHGPCSVRHLFYLAVVNDVIGITKDESGYDKVQRQVLELRRSGSIPYHQIVDGSRLTRRVGSWGSASDALEHVAALYRRNLWEDQDLRPEIWCESDSIASVIVDTAFEWTIPVMSTSGDVGEAFAWNAAQDWLNDHREPMVFYIGDHDGAGLHMEQVLREKLERFYGGYPFGWKRVGITLDQAVDNDLPSQPAQPKDAKRGYVYDRKWEAEAMPPGLLRDLLRDEIVGLHDPHAVEVLRVAEQSERDLLVDLARRMGRVS